MDDTTDNKKHVDIKKKNILIRRNTYDLFLTKFPFQKLSLFDFLNLNFPVKAGGNRLNLTKLSRSELKPLGIPDAVQTS